MTAISNPLKPAVGVHRVPFLTYCAWEHLNWHRLEPYRETPKIGRFKEMNPDESTDSKILGGAFHTAVLEPALFDNTYAAMPKFEGHHASTAHKEAKSKWLAENKKLVPLKADEIELLMAMQNAARSDSLASAMLYDQGGKNEMSIVWEDERTGVTCKGRIDRLARIKIGILNPNAANPEANALCLIDVKTTRKIKPVMFATDAAKLGYHAQLAFYRDGLNRIQPAPVSVFIVAIENKPPYDVVVHQVGEEELEQGRLLYRRLLNTVQECQEKQRWPGYSNGRVVPLVLPKWIEEDSEEE